MMLLCHEHLILESLGKILRINALVLLTWREAKIESGFCKVFNVLDSKYALAVPVGSSVL